MLSLEHLIQHYQKFPDGLPISLKYNVPPMPKPPLPLPPHARTPLFKPQKKLPMVIPPPENAETQERRGSVPTRPPPKEKDTNSKNTNWIKSLTRKNIPLKIFIKNFINDYY